MDEVKFKTCTDISRGKTCRALEVHFTQELLSTSFKTLFKELFKVYKAQLI